MCKLWVKIIFYSLKYTSLLKSLILWDRSDFGRIDMGRHYFGPDWLGTGLDCGQNDYFTTPVYLQLVSCNFNDYIFCSNCHVMIDSSLYSYLTDIFAPDHVYSTFLQFKTWVFTSYTNIGVEDVQSTILLCLLVWLLINIVLIKIAWTLYGQHICQKFLRQG